MNRFTLILAGLALGASSLIADPIALAGAPPVGSGFTYQGQLKQSGAPFSGNADFQFKLFESAAGITQIGGTLAANVITVSEGVFTVQLDFGAAAYATGEERWLEIAVTAPSTNGVGPFTILAPRQELTPAPFAVHALSATISGAQPNLVSFSNPGNTFNGIHSGSGGSLTSLNANNLASGTVASARISGAYTNALTLNNAGNAFTGSGAGLTSLDAGNISAGNLNVARLPTGGTWTLASNLTIAGAGGLRAPNLVDSDNVSFSLDPSNTGISFNYDGSLRTKEGEGIQIGAFAAGFVANAWTIGGDAIVIRLGDTTGDSVSVPAKEFFMSDTTTIADGDQSLFFTDGGVTNANFLKWDDVATFVCAGAVGNLNSVFDSHIADDLDSGWVFTTGATSTDAEVRWDDDGNVQADGAFTSLNACDLAEAFLGEDDLPPGSIVVLDPARPEGVILSSHPYQKGIVGAISTMPAILMNGPTADAYPLAKEWRAYEAAASMSATERELAQELDSLNDDAGDETAAGRRNEIVTALQGEYAARAAANAVASDYERQFENWTRGNVQVALVGRVPVRVIGPVHAGDYLTTSDVPGVAMAMTQPGPTIGVALQDFAGSGEGMVVTLIQPGWHGGDGLANAQPCQPGQRR